MLTEAKTDEISEKIAAIFQGMELDDVAGILKIQLAMLVTQGTDDADAAMEFLDEIYEDVEQMVESFPFGEEGDEDEEDEEDEDDDKDGKPSAN
ncbi:hypothetical protein NS365_09025 [Aureimonas ureilytica]|uniref:Uncharacterized protein n=1 Tax=Aureimonas ureilytica TaxID=401562 RepID=A0A175R5I8_9HYPH|nr:MULTISPECIES: hypothetical protein [Aureimonas]KTQ85452.1 hypothetical protein NS226_19565 [Aureimonas ureilytica]KTR05935.1 hypothetical protein NS365_09025 [Aureimonas ureilytica]